MKKPSPLKIAIVASGRKAKTVARMARVDVTLLSHWCNNRRTPKPDEAQRLADVLELPLGVLFPAIAKDEAATAQQERTHG